MNLEYYTLDELNGLLNEIVASQLESKHYLVRALQNAIAEKHLEAFEDAVIAPNDLQNQLMKKTVKELDTILSSFLEVGVSVPKELWSIIEIKKAKEGKALLLEMLKK